MNARVHKYKIGPGQLQELLGKTVGPGIFMFSIKTSGSLRKNHQFCFNQQTFHFRKLHTSYFTAVHCLQKGVLRCKMISKKYLYSIIFVVAALCVFLSHSSPVPNEEAPTNREGRFYGYGGSQAMASASAGAGGFGYPGGFGMGGSSAFASANAGAGGLMYGK